MKSVLLATVMSAVTFTEAAPQKPTSIFDANPPAAVSHTSKHAPLSLNASSASSKFALKDSFGHPRARVDRKWTRRDGSRVGGAKADIPSVAFPPFLTENLVARGGHRAAVDSPTEEVFFDSNSGNAAAAASRGKAKGERMGPFSTVRKSDVRDNWARRYISSLYSKRVREEFHADLLAGGPVLWAKELDNGTQHGYIQALSLKAMYPDETSQLRPDQFKFTADKAFIASRTAHESWKARLASGEFGSDFDALIDATFDERDEKAIARMASRQGGKALFGINDSSVELSTKKARQEAKLARPDWTKVGGDVWSDILKPKLDGSFISMARDIMKKYPGPEGISRTTFLDIFGPRHPYVSGWEIEVEKYLMEQGVKIPTFEKSEVRKDEEVLSELREQHSESFLKNPTYEDRNARLAKEAISRRAARRRVSNANWLADIDAPVPSDTPDEALDTINLDSLTPEQRRNLQGSGPPASFQWVEPTWSWPWDLTELNLPMWQTWEDGKFDPNAPGGYDHSLLFDEDTISEFGAAGYLSMSWNPCWDPVMHPLIEDFFIRNKPCIVTECDSDNTLFPGCLDDPLADYNYIHGDECNWSYRPLAYEREYPNNFSPINLAHEQPACLEITTGLSYADPHFLDFPAFCRPERVNWSFSHVTKSELYPGSGQRDGCGSRKRSVSDNFYFKKWHEKELDWQNGIVGICAINEF